jgi:hypothetical protein
MNCNRNCNSVGAQVALIRLTQVKGATGGLVVIVDTVDREAIYEELRHARTTFRRLVEEGSPEDLARGPAGPGGPTRSCCSTCCSATCSPGR